MFLMLARGSHNLGQHRRLVAGIEASRERERMSDDFFARAGGLGILATGPLNAKATGEAIDEIRRMTDKPFAIGATLLMPGASENVEVAIEKKVPVVNFSLGKGDEIVRRVHAYGGKVIATVVSEKHARSAIASGVDALMVTGMPHTQSKLAIHILSQ
jgi:NAD(P)H-dependent flavin oxidoreductase YrpB (nitropropane dioxygenase family)